MDKPFLLHSYKPAKQAGQSPALVVVKVVQGDAKLTTPPTLHISWHLLAKYVRDHHPESFAHVDPDLEVMQLGFSEMGVSIWPGKVIE